jgi:hypothetical protein
VELHKQAKLAAAKEAAASKQHKALEAQVCAALVPAQPTSCRSKC